MSTYVDTSIIVSALTEEVSSEASREWLQAQTPGTMCISQCVITEIHSALALKLRTGQISREQRSRIIAEFRLELLPNLRIADIEAIDFTRAADLVDNDSCVLRSGDALHLAIASRFGLAIATIDKRFKDAAFVLNVASATP